MDAETEAIAQKLTAMHEEKQQRVLNAAMEEFTKGFNAASTDNIVKKAGISKGLLFHYFGTKKGLYLYVIDYALETLAQHYTPLLEAENGDLLERLWQMSLLKRQLCGQHPDIFAFLTAAYYGAKDEPGNDFAQRFGVLQQQIFHALYENIDQSILRPGLDKQMASNLIRWTLQGLSDQVMAERRSFAEMAEDYDFYLTETKRYLDLLRQLLYRT